MHVCDMPAHFVVVLLILIIDDTSDLSWQLVLGSRRPFLLFRVNRLKMQRTYSSTYDDLRKCDLRK
jgi:hypothetical protein